MYISTYIRNLANRGLAESKLGFGLLVFAVLLTANADYAVAKELYVDGASGNDSVSYDENSATSPWATIGRAVWGNANRTGANSGQAARAGDVVIVRSGTYSTTQGTSERYEPIYNPVNSGQSSAPIMIRADGQVTLQSNTGGEGEPIVGTYNRDHIVWDGFYIDEQNVHTKSDTGPIVVWQSNGVVIQNFVVDGYSRGWVDNHNAIRLEYADDVLIRNNILRGYSEPNNGMNASVITAYHTASARIEHNEISDANTGIFVKGVNTGPFTIRFNRISNVRSAVQFGGIGTSSGSNGAVAYGNIITDAYAGFAFIGYDNVSPANVTVANNTIYGVRGSDGGGILFRPESGGYRNLRFHNNLIVETDSAISAWHSGLSQTTFSHNNYDSVTAVAYIEWSRHSLQSWQATFGKDRDGSSTIAPRFVDEANGDFRLAADSPLLNAGLDVLDLDGDSQNSDPVSIGAYAVGDEIVGLTTELADPDPPPPQVTRTPMPPTLQ